MTCNIDVNITDHLFSFMNSYIIRYITKHTIFFVTANKTVYMCGETNCRFIEYIFVSVNCYITVEINNDVPGFTVSFCAVINSFPSLSVGFNISYH